MFISRNINCPSSTHFPPGKPIQRVKLTNPFLQNGGSYLSRVPGGHDGGPGGPDAKDAISEEFEKNLPSTLLPDSALQLVGDSGKPLFERSEQPGFRGGAYPHGGHRTVDYLYGFSEVDREFQDSFKLSIGAQFGFEVFAHFHFDTFLNKNFLSRAGAHDGVHGVQRLEGTYSLEKIARMFWRPYRIGRGSRPRASFGNTQ